MTALALAWLWPVLGGALQALALSWPWAGWEGLGLLPGQPSAALQLLGLVLLSASLQRSPHWAAAAFRAWLFALAWLVGSFWWLYISMHVYGGLPAPLAALAVLALASALGLYLAVVAGLWRAWRPDGVWRSALLFAAFWLLAEWARARWLTGFPWGATGYAQIDNLGHWAPWIGVYGIGAVTVLAVFGSTSVFLRPQAHAAQVHPNGRRPPWLAPASGAAAIWLLLLGAPQATRDGALQATQDQGRLSAWLLQGNVAQDEKFDASTGIHQALTWYPEQIALAQAERRLGAGPQLLVAPETALPLLAYQLGPDFWRAFLRQVGAGAATAAGPTNPTAGASPAAQPGPSAADFGVLFGLPLGDFETGYANSAWGWSAGRAQQALAEMEAGGAPQVGAPWSAEAMGQHAYRYDKHHLVPFGEFVPPLFRWFIDLMNIPLGDFSRGALPQAPWSFAGQRLAPHICYEDLFGEELAAGMHPVDQAPTVLLNLSNIAWFGDSLAIDQHLQIARMRAMELGRPVLRATNTGATAAIDHRGRVVAELPRFTQGRLAVEVQGRAGLTPYAQWAGRWGLWPLVGLALLLVLLLRQPGAGRSRR